MESIDYIFIGLTLGCAVFLGKIIVDYLNEIPIWKEKIDQAELIIEECDAKVQALGRENDSSSEQSKVIDDEIKKMESMANDLKAEIEKTKKEMARKGRIIMRRTTDGTPEV
jgi:chromosome segregation ATPase